MKDYISPTDLWNVSRYPLVYFLCKNHIGDGVSWTFESSEMNPDRVAF